MVFDLIGPFIFGLAGSGHCLGMCGPLIVAYSLHLRPAESQGPTALWPPGAGHHAVFHAGRLFAYGLLGAVAAGIAGDKALHHLFASFRGTVTLGGGALMVVFGASLLGALPMRASGLPMAAGPVASSQARQTSARKPWPAALSSVRRSAPRSP